MQIDKFLFDPAAVTLNFSLQYNSTAYGREYIHANESQPSS